jgi:hypothetical protein
LLFRSDGTALLPSWCDMLPRLSSVGPACDGARENTALPSVAHISTSLLQLLNDEHAACI